MKKELDEQREEKHEMKLAKDGKTNESKKDLERLQEIRKRRE